MFMTAEFQCSNDYCNVILSTFEVQKQHRFGECFSEEINIIYLKFLK